MLTFVLISVTLSLIVIIVEWKLRKNRLRPPGPFQWPVIGNLHLMRKLSRQYRGQHRAFNELSRRYSSNVVSLRLGSSNVMAVSGYQAIRKILHSDEFDGRPWNEFIKLRNMGLKKGITMSDGPEWKTVRAWVVRSLRSVGFGRAEMLVHLKAELQLILENIKDGGVFCPKSIISPAMANVVWILTAGQRMPDQQKLKRFIELMDQRAVAFDMAGGSLSIFPWLRHIAPRATGYKLLLTLNEELKKLLRGTIEEHSKNYVPGETGSNLINMFLDKMHNEKAESRIFDEDQLFLILLDLLIAGSITTTSTLDFLLLRMTVHQEIQRRLHQELDLVIGRDRLPELNERLKLPYTEAVITESQRIQMVAPIIGPRRATRDTTLEGYRIPKDSCLLLNVWSIHMNPEYYPDPESFDPERFIKNGSYVPDEKLIFFGGGHRRCPGEADAKAALFLFFVGIMQRFQLLPKPGQEPPDIEPNFGITISPKKYEILLVPR